VPRGYLTPAAARQRYVPNVSTVQLQAQTWPTVARIRDLRPGLLDSGGRLTRSGCPGGNSASSGGYGGLESAFLGSFVQSGTSVTDLRALVLSGAVPTPAQEGWLSPHILRCGRLALVPVLGAVPSPFSTVPSSPYHYGLTATTYQVTGLRLVWIDNTFGEGDPAPIAYVAGRTRAACSAASTGRTPTTRAGARRTTRTTPTCGRSPATSLTRASSRRPSPARTP
jgi:hypothetical protein